MVEVGPNLTRVIAAIRAILFVSHILAALFCMTTTFQLALLPDVFEIPPHVALIGVVGVAASVCGMVVLRQAIMSPALKFLTVVYTMLLSHVQIEMQSEIHAMADFMISQEYGKATREGEHSMLLQVFHNLFDDFGCDASLTKGSSPRWKWTCSREMDAVQAHQVESLLAVLCNWVPHEEAHGWAFSDLQERFDSQVQTCRATRDEPKYCSCSVTMGMRVRAVREFLVRHKNKALAYLAMSSISLVATTVFVTCFPDPKLFAAALGGQFAVLAYWFSAEERSALQLILEAVGSVLTPIGEYF
jgi:hypothetical protein